MVVQVLVELLVEVAVDQELHIVVLQETLVDTLQ